MTSKVTQEIWGRMWKTEIWERMWETEMREKPRWERNRDVREKPRRERETEMWDRNREVRENAWEPFSLLNWGFVTELGYQGGGRGDKQWESYPILFWKYAMTPTSTCLSRGLELLKMYPQHITPSLGPHPILARGGARFFWKYAMKPVCQEVVNCQ